MTLSSGRSCRVPADFENPTVIRRSRVIPGLAVALLLGSALAAQEAESPFFEVVDVNVVNIEVFVTDKKGNPVSGLVREDFEVYEDGRRVLITNFSAVADGRPVRAIESVPPDRLNQAETKGEIAPAPDPRRPLIPLQEVPEAQRLHLVVYIDNFNIEPFHRNRVFNRLREFLLQLERSDRVMLVSYDRTLNIRHRFTDNPRLIAATLNELEKLTGFRLQANRERRDILRAIDNADSPEGVMLRTRQHASSVANDLRFTLAAMRDTVQSLSGLPGRKALLYASDGLPMVPARDLFFVIRQKFQYMSAVLESQDFDATRQFKELANQANAAGVTFYTIDASGLQSLTAGDAENARASSIDGGGAFADSLNLSNLQSSIQFIAERTGGTAIVNTNDIGRGLDRVASDFKNYYSLGYSPSGAGDGRFHEVEVKTLEKRFNVRHRAGYRDKSLSQRMSERTVSSLRHGYQVNPLDVRLSVGEPSVHQDNFAAPFLIQIPLKKIVLVPRGTLYQGRVRIYFTAMDERGGIAEVQQDQISIEIPTQDFETAQNKHYAYEASLLLRRGRHIVGVGIQDEYGTAASFVSQSVDAGSG